MHGQGQSWGQPGRLQGHTDQVATIAPHHSPPQVSCLAVDASGKLAASGGWDGRVVVWQLEGEGGREGEVKIGEYVNTVCWGEQGELWAGGKDGQIVRIEICKNSQAC